MTPAEYEQVLAQYNRLSSKTDTMILMIQGWLDWQEMEYRNEGNVVTDDTAFYSVPQWPTRGQWKAWIAHMQSLENRIKELETQST